MRRTGSAASAAVIAADVLDPNLQQAAAEGTVANVRRWCAFAGWRPGLWIELQALKVPYQGRTLNLYAHAADPDRVAALLAELEPAYIPAFYVIANHVSEATVARHHTTQTPAGAWARHHGEATTDDDVPLRSVLYVDVDFERPVNTSATDEELAAAQAAARRIVADLAQYTGPHALAVGCSGNGASVFIALDHLPETPEVRGLVDGVLRAIKALHEGGGVKIDAHLSDPKRLVPAFGTVKRKGPPNDPLRPHRTTSILTMDQVRRLSLAELRYLCDVLRARVPAPPPAPAYVAPVLPPDPGDDGEDPPDDAVDPASLRKRLQKLRRKKAGSADPRDQESFRILTAVLNGAPLAPHGDRAKTLNRACSTLAFIFPPGTPWEIAREVLRPSVAAMAEPEGVEYWFSWEQGESSWSRASQRAFAEYQRREQEKAQNEAARQALLAIRRELPPVPPNTPGYLGAAAAITPAISELEEVWIQDLIRTSDGKIKSCPHNVYLFLTHAPVLKGTIRFNDAESDIQVVGGPFATMPPPVLASAVQNWVHKVGKLEVGKNVVEDQILLVAYENRFDPVADYLNGLTWDGVPRIDRLFFDYVRARTVNADGVDLTDHLRRVGAKFLISAVARRLRPGCEVHTMLVLEGNEGEGKTTFLKIMFGEYYVVAKLGYEKDDQMVQGAAWGVEYGELASTRQSDDELLKQHLSSSEDRYRPPYGRRTVTFKRKNVFVGTTNDENWLTSGKGRRRYWPVHALSVNLAALARDRDQLWAEAVARFRGYVDDCGEVREPERWHLEGDERAVADAEAGLRMEETIYQQKIESWFYARPAGKRFEIVTLIDVVESALAIPVDRANNKLVMKDINGAMTRAGFERKRSHRRGSAFVWHSTQEMRDKP